jgi:hypothetical protein
MSEASTSQKYYIGVTLCPHEKEVEQCQQKTYDRTSGFCYYHWKVKAGILEPEKLRYRKKRNS